MAKFAQLFRNDHAAKPAPETASADLDQESLREAHFTLLFVDDEPSVLKALQRIFIDENYRILTTDNPEQALAILAQDKIHLIISDHRMPGMTGAELLKQIKEKYPEVIRIMLTGFADIQSVMGAVNEGAVYKFITKPWNDEDLRLTVSLALQQYVLLQENKKLKQVTEKQQLKIRNYSSILGENHAFLGTILAKSKVLEPTDFQQAMQHRLPNEFIIQALARLGLTSESQVVKALQDQLHLEYLDLRELDLNPEIIRSLPRELCEKNCMIPIRLEGRSITLAMADPTDIYKIDNIARQTGLKVNTVIARCSEISQQLQQTYGVAEKTGEMGLEGIPDLDPMAEIDIIIEEDEEQCSVQELLGSSEIPPIIRIVNAIISEAIRYQASDIHIEPKTKYSVVRFRIDGMLFDKIRIPADLHLATVSRIKILSKLDIAERRRPQDGRITVKSGTRMVDLRVSTMPSINGEKIVMRVLDKSASVKPLVQLGFMENELARLNALIKKPQGIIISSGPTGSGKTTLLYSILAQMLERTKNFETIEDPVEYFLEEVNQVYIKEQDGLSFASVLRATLRQDPDVILVGEVRDLETADVAFKAALTGHMVLTSLHTNSSIASITRLIDLGIKPYLISSALEGIIAQRLVRTLCKHCRVKTEPDPELMKLLRVPDNLYSEGVWATKGCQRCNSSGYFGRTGVYELFVMNDEFRHLISESYRESQLMRMARAGGFKTLREDGLNKVAMGLTSLDELLRVLGPQIRHERTCASCQQEINAKYHYCPYCGDFKQNICINCQEPMENDWSVCTVCGTSRKRA
ncbi:MAG: Flp pilus assembly complex ATPase component TadA [Desulfuromonadales bacterium]|nr:Flp pilus assembly complex ATPase component TadA [Desulfuromonadales bacterium]